MGSSSHRQGTLPNAPNDEVVAALERIATLLEFEGGTADVAEAFRRAGRAVRACGRNLATVVEEDGVEGVHQLGIGYHLSGLLTDWQRTGRLPLLERLEARHAPERRLTRVPGIGPRLAREVHHALGVDDLESLEAVTRDGRLAAVCGFGPRRVRLVQCALASMLPRRRRPPKGTQLDLLIH